MTGITDYLVTPVTSHTGINPNGQARSGYTRKWLPHSGPSYVTSEVIRKLIKVGRIWSENYYRS